VSNVTNAIKHALQISYNFQLCALSSSFGRINALKMTNLSKLLQLLRCRLLKNADVQSIQEDKVMMILTKCIHEE
jgi:hypothetical protein